MPLSTRTLFISDVHLGCKHARTDALLEFLQQYSPQTLYLVGDFFDAWKINSGWYWPKICDRIVQHLMRLASEGTQILYTPGNHDSFLRQATLKRLLPAGFPEVTIADEFCFESVQGSRLLVTHGDLFDFFETKAQWISKGSSAFYDACLSFNRMVQRQLLSPTSNPYGACATIKGRVKRGVKFISQYETKLMRHAKALGYDGAICGHIHTPVLKPSEHGVYCNTGDWVENCTGLIEHHDGTIELAGCYRKPQILDLASFLPSANRMEGQLETEWLPTAGSFEWNNAPDQNPSESPSTDSRECVA